MTIKTPADWWAAFDANRDDLRRLVGNFHPVHANEDWVDEFPISAGAAEEMCKQVRKEITSPLLPQLEFDEAALNRNPDVIVKLLNQTWFGVPESYESRSLPGFFVLCDLCSESWVFEEGDCDGS